MIKKIALAGLMSVLATGTVRSEEDYSITPQLLDTRGDDKKTSFFTPGKEYFVGVYVDYQHDYLPSKIFDYLEWKFGEIKGGEITHAFAPLPVYLFSDYFVGRDMDPQTNSVTAEGGVRAVQHNQPQNTSGKSKGLVGIYKLRTDPHASTLEINLTNIQAYAFTSATSNVPLTVKSLSLTMPSIAEFKAPLEIRKIDRHPWDPTHLMPDHVQIQTSTNTYGFFQILDESTDLKNWHWVRKDDDTIHYLTSTTNFPAAFYRVRFEEW